MKRVSIIGLIFMLFLNFVVLKPHLNLFVILSNYFTVFLRCTTYLSHFPVLYGYKGSPHTALSVGNQWPSSVGF